MHIGCTSLTTSVYYIQATTHWSEDQIRLHWRSTISFTKKGKKDHTFRLFEVGLTWKSSVTMKDPDSLPCQHHFMVTWAGASIWTTNYVFLLSQLNPFFGMMPFPRKSHFLTKYFLNNIWQTIILWIFSNLYPSSSPTQKDKLGL